MADSPGQATPDVRHELVTGPPALPVEPAVPVETSMPIEQEPPTLERLPVAEERRHRTIASPTSPSKWAALFRLVLFAAISLGIYYAWPWIAPWMSLVSRKPVEKPRQRVIPVATATVRKGDMDLYLNGLGTVTAFYTVTVRSRVEGQLVGVHFTEGQLVKKDDLLAEIDPRPFEVQLAQAEGQLERDRATLKVNKLSLERYKELLKTRSITPQQMDEQVALVDQMEGAIRTDLAAVDNAELQLTYSHITAPISGRIGLRLIDPGNMVRATEMNGIAVITQLQPIALVFTVPQDNISLVQRKANSGETLGVDAYDRDFKNKLATGKLLAIDNQVDSTTGTVRLKAVFENQDNMLFPNQFVNARLLIDQKRDAVITPAAAVQRGPDFDFVYRVKDDETVELRQVELGPTEGDQTVVETGLSAGDVVVTDGIDKLQPGAKVSTKKGESQAATADASEGASKSAGRAKPPEA
ncbi:MAG TPA: MdtA/MuxA family multidrug efflux RND transporter periplasmic adaptor subunit [Pirellulales bacterium]|nr:MdtA/MuxA family multidrug efflux RND transporter periplasmic adaptor subunit [Pirellulales bacterium]